METDDSFVNAHFLHRIFDFDYLSVYNMTKFFESFGNLDSVNRAEDSALRAGFSTDLELNAFEGCSGSFSISFNFFELVSALFLVFCPSLKSSFRCDNGLSLRDEIIAAVSVFYFDYVILIAETRNIFFKN